MEAAAASSELARITERKERLRVELTTIERQIYDLEGAYLEQTRGSGNVLTGFGPFRASGLYPHGFLQDPEEELRKDAPTALAARDGRSVAHRERLFSLSSTTSAASAGMSADAARAAFRARPGAQAAEAAEAASAAAREGTPAAAVKAEGDGAGGEPARASGAEPDATTAAGAARPREAEERAAEDEVAEPPSKARKVK